MTDNIWMWIFVAVMVLNAVALVRHHLALRRFNSIQRKLEAQFATLEAMMDIPRDKTYSADAVQCHGCGGHGCSACGKRGWVAAGDANGRLCLRFDCGKPIPPAHVAVYCSNECARLDA